MDVALDTGPLISLSNSCLLWIIPKLKNFLQGEFYIPRAVLKEAVEKPMNIKLYELDALRILDAIRKGWLKEAPEELKEPLSQRARDILFYGNNIFSVRGIPLKILHLGECEALALGTLLDSKVVIIDERTARTLVEDWKSVARNLEKRYGEKVEINKFALRKFQKLTQGLRFLRSAELVAIAYEKGLFNNHYMPKKYLEAALYAVKGMGCAVTTEEIDDYLTSL